MHSILFIEESPLLILLPFHFPPPISPLPPLPSTHLTPPPTSLHPSHPSSHFPPPISPLLPLPFTHLTPPPTSLHPSHPSSHFPLPISPLLLLPSSSSHSPPPQTNSQGVTRPLDVITLHHKLLQVVAGEWQQRAEMGGAYTLDVQKHVRKLLLYCYPELELVRDWAHLSVYIGLWLVYSCSQMCVWRIHTFWGKCVLPSATGSQQQREKRGATRRNRRNRGSRPGAMCCRLGILLVFLSVG